jgi:large subunit ribosomal protein L10
VPTQEKADRVKDLKEKLEKCSIALATDYTGIPGDTLTELRQRMRAAGMEFTVVKNTLANLAAEAAQRPQVKDIVQGPTAFVFGYQEPVDAVKMLSDYIRTTRSTLTIRGAVMGPGPAMLPAQVAQLATLPPRPQLVANLLGQLQAPIARLMGVLNGPLGNLDALLQARIRQLESTQPGG